MLTGLVLAVEEAVGLFEGLVDGVGLDVGVLVTELVGETDGVAVAGAVDVDEGLDDCEIWSQLQ